MIRFYILLCLFTVNISFSQTNQPADSLSIPIKALFHQNDHSSFSISPNGQYFAEVIESSWGSDIVIVDIDGYKLFNKIRVSYGRVGGVYWLNDERILYENSGRLHAVDIDGEFSTLIASSLKANGARRSSIFGRLILNEYIGRFADNPDELLVKTYNTDFEASIDRVNMLTGRRISLLAAKRHKMNDWLVDATGSPRIGLRVEKEILKYYRKHPTEEEWIPLTLNIGNEIIPVEVLPSSYLNQKVSVEGFSYDRDVVYLTILADNDKRSLVAYNLKKNAIIETIASNQICDIQVPDGNGLTLIPDHKNFSLAGVRYDGLVPQQVWFSDTYREAQNELKEQYPGFIHDIIDSDQDQNRLVILQWSDVNAGNIGIYDISTGEYAVMFHLNPDLNEYTLSPTKVKILKSRDGHALPSYLNMPTDKNITNPPLIVMPHGGPWARDTWGIDPYVQYYTSRGFAVLRVNFRGSTGFGLKHMLSGVENIHTVMIDDIFDATQAIVKEDVVNGDQVFVFGHSYGGYAAYLLLSNYGEHFKGAISVSAPTNIKTWLRTQRREKHKFSVEFWETALGSRKSSYLKEISPVYNVDDINKPVLILHGQYDETVPLEQAEAMYEALMDQGKDVEYHELKGEGHSPEKLERLQFMFRRSEAFMLELMEK